MATTLSLPGMLPATLAVLAVDVASLFLMTIIAAEFRHVARKYEHLLCTVTHQRQECACPPQRCHYFSASSPLIWIYIASTLLLTAAATVLFL